jgi:hypothetical protein
MTSEAPPQTGGHEASGSASLEQCLIARAFARA